MTTKTILHVRKNASHYTCSKPNYSQKCNVASPYKGTLKLGTCISIMILVLCSMLFLVGCSKDTHRQQGEFPNIPAVMDEYQKWDTKQFASNMNLSQEFESAMAPNWAKDITQESNGDKVQMSLKDTWKNVSDVVYIILSAEHSSGAISGEVVDEIEGLERYNYGFDDAVSLLQKCGIEKNDIKVYDDLYSKGVKVDYTNSIVTLGSSYVMCGETSTKNGNPLYFSIEAVADYACSINQNTQIPADSVALSFSTSEPFSLDSATIFSSQSDEPLDDEVIYDDLQIAANGS